MTLVRLHGILAQEYGDTFTLAITNPKNTLHAIDCNKKGFIRRLIELHKEGLPYDLIINKTRITHEYQIDSLKNPERIDLVPAITGNGPISLGAIFLNIGKALLFAAISFALAPKPPEPEALELTADAGRESLIFSNVANVASQGAPLPVGFGRLKVGSQVIQATIKSYPQHQKQRDALVGEAARAGSNSRYGRFAPIMQTSKATDQRNS